VVVSSAAYHASRSDVIIAGITSNVSRDRFVGQVTLADWEACGLENPSAISGIVMTVRDSVIGRRIGRLSAADSVRLDAALRESLSL
jgi:mRNA-degrading endonuclease toxin of MazEF toxin-antitoxin module